MKRILFATLALFCGSTFAAEGQIASLVSFESTAARPKMNKEQDGSLTSLLSTQIEYTTPANISAYAGFSFALGDNFESAFSMGARYYSATPAFQLFPGIPMWSFIGGGVYFLDSATYYPEAGFRIATSDTSRLDVFVKLLNSSDDKYDRHVMVGAGLTF
ncbi:hypothetical protein MSP8887_02281 [Marinomonas spartinae]|uniref:Outer membrane protein beta-barrel domain-containing protein n=1 Tax=Marinomonas spartinae TaxID=1792290 RepID=A0A1A8TTU0_9GAMM|nr:hypothetical protein [Marinomonas spartinae]SBS35025.1 hypothetical protein MSP8887_02281 [Marinomonas spartinae]SBS36508.1 hypothetical protein MSP8886_03729 [Marinomonas spartinae]